MSCEWNKNKIKIKLPRGLVLSPGLLTLKPGVSTERVAIEVTNFSKHPVTIPAKSELCELHQVSVVPPGGDRVRELTTPECNNMMEDAEVRIEKVDENQGAPERNSNEADPDQPSADYSFIAEMREALEQHLDQHQIKEAENLLCQWKDAFSQHDLGHATKVRHHIKLTDDHPFKERSRRITPAMIEEVRKHLQEMLELGVIKRSESPYASNIVLVKKKDGTLRFCIDLRLLNNLTVRDAYALPRIDDTLDALQGAQWFSTLDLKSLYWQVEIAEEDQHKTAFTVGPLGFFECQRMPFGLTNVPATFQRLMESCMGDLYLNYCLLYLDDIVIYSKTYEEHLVRLEAVFKRLRENGLKLKPSKCKLYQRSIRYLGHIISQDGVLTDPEKIRVVQEWPVPKNATEVQSFLGFVGFYRRFIKQFSKVARPLHEVVQQSGQCHKKKGRQKTQSVPFSWGDSQQQAFEDLVKLCTSTQVSPISLSPLRSTPMPALRVLEPSYTKNRTATTG